MKKSNNAEVKSYIYRRLLNRISFRDLEEYYSLTKGLVDILEMEVQQEKESSSLQKQYCKHNTISKINNFS